MRSGKVLNRFIGLSAIFVMSCEASDTSGLILEAAEEEAKHWALSKAGLAFVILGLTAQI